MASTARQHAAPSRTLEAVTAAPSERAAVEKLFRVLDDLLQSRAGRPVRGEFVGRRGRHAPVPGSVIHVLERIAQAMARGDAVAVVPVGRDLTTQQAADLLNVSRQYLVRLVDEGRIPAGKTGKHRRLRLADVLAFKEMGDRARRASLRALTRATEAAGGYEAEDE
jgi:excisionase family DNA binding protein